MEQAEAELLSSFLSPMLNYYPDSRATAGDMARHPWLSGVVVDGEIEMEKLGAAGPGGAAGAGGAGAGGNGVGGTVPSAANPIGAQAAAGGPVPSSSSSSNAAGSGNGKKDSGGAKKKGKGALEEVMKLGPAVKGMVGMGRI